jgi:fumarate reductase flavoprotein subunit|nr:FAD-binding protein [uncultured Lachnoclostridium sp.]
MKKKTLALLMATTMVVSVLSGCGKKADNEVSSTPTPTVEATQTPENEDKTEEVSYDRTESADVIVVGGGGAGLSAALEASSNGASSVIVLEQLGMTGGELNATSGTISGAETIIQELDGFTEDTLESYKQDIIHEGSKQGGKPNEALIDVYVEAAKDSVNWMWELGLKDYEFATDKEGRKSVFAPEHTLFSYPRSYKPKAKDTSTYKSATHELLDTKVKEDENIRVDLNTTAVGLLGNDKGQVLSVVAENNGEKVLYTANKGIVMATGGYSANAKLIEAFNQEAHGVITGGLSSAMGTGIYLMQEVGGAITEEAMSWVPTFPMGLENPSVPGTGRIMTTKTQFAGGILVNKNGERFVDETSADNAAREKALEIQPEGIQWEVYTEDIVEDLLKSSVGGMYQFFFMTEAGAGYIESASSLEELAKVIEVPYENLKATVESYNAHVEAGDVDEFGRKFVEEEGNSFNVAVNKIEGDKFYAVKIKPLCVITMGGVQVNTDMQVVNEAGNVIPGLYAAGEVVGGVWGRYISSGVGVMGSVAFGRVAGKNVATLPLATGEEVKPASNLIDKSLFIKDEATSEDIFDMNVSLKDGEYEASVAGQEGTMTVKVTITGGKIANVEILEQHETESIAKGALESIPKAIVDANSVNVDAYSSATLTSNRIKEAVAACLEQAKN